MTEHLPQQVDVKLPPDTSSVVVAKVVYGLHSLSIVIGVVTGGSILGAFLFGWPSIVAVILNYVTRLENAIARQAEQLRDALARAGIPDVKRECDTDETEIR